MKRRVGNWVILLLVLLACALPFSALAAGMSNEVQVALTADQAEYQGGDVITLTLSVNNESPTALVGVEMSLVKPDGSTLVPGDTLSKKLAVLGVGETAEHTARFQLAAAPVPPPPQTGDSFPLALLLGLAALSGGVCLLGRKWCKRLLCMLLCVMLGLGGVMLPATGVAEAATLTAQTTVRIHGVNVALKGQVRYTTELPVTGDEISYSEPDPSHIHPAAGGMERYYVDNELLLTAGLLVTRAQVDVLVQRLGAEIVGAIDVAGEYQIRLPESKTESELTALAEQVAKQPIVDSAYVHYFYPMDYAADPTNDAKWSGEWGDIPEGKNWGFEAVRAREAWEHRNQMQSVNVGVIDSMFDTDHEDLANVFVSGGVYNNDPEPSSSHGTNVTGIIAAQHNNGIGIAGMAPTARVYAVSVGNTHAQSSSNGRSINSAFGIKYALSLLMVTHRTRVINFSQALYGNEKVPSDVGDSCARNWATQIDPFLRRLLDKGFDFLIVAGAANVKQDVTWHQFFSLCTQSRSNILIVSASENLGKEGWFWETPRWKGVGFVKDYCYGEQVDILAPGAKIYSTAKNNDYQGDRSGTSMATPFVTGAAANCFAVSPTLTGRQVKQIILDTARSEGSYSATYLGRTYPHLDAGAAVERALDMTGTVYFPPEGIVTGGVTDSRGTKLENVTVSARRISEDGLDVPVSYATTTTDSEGTYSLILDAGTYDILFSLEGYWPLAINNVVVGADEVIYLDNVPLSSVDTMGEDFRIMQIRGKVTDALTGKPIEGVTIRFAKGWGFTTPDASLGSCTTKADGTYEMELLSGNYTALLNKAGYANAQGNIHCIPYDTRQDFTMIPTQADEQFRIVLTWADAPKDVDSHLSGIINGTPIHVYYDNKQARVNNELIAKLDYDDTDRYGPETTTIYVPSGSWFRFSLHDYTNRNSSNSQALSLSGAKVVVYRGNTLLRTFNIPAYKNGTVWHVFEISPSGSVISLGSLENISDPRLVDAVFRGEVTLASLQSNASYHEDDKDGQ